MQPDSCSYKWENTDQVELTVPGASSRGRRGKGLCLSDATQAKAVVILLALLMICFVVTTALIVMRLGKLSQDLADTQLDQERIRNGSKMKLSDLKDYLEIKNLTHNMLKELAETKRDSDIFQEALSRVQEALWNITEFICTKCPPGWQPFEKSCYFFSTLTKSWPEAKQFCIDQGSHLVIVNTKLEQTFLSRYITEPEVYWLGLSDSATEGEWRWLDGSPLSVRFWGSGEPNNVGPQGEDCGSLQFSGKWNDAICSRTELWICERPC
ncbi:C-type lectin domain family 17, member A [Carettochelys insculpta]|uniref:C-type lectin domain family 17, member A n=1 Tax=Carettochelys insculpta TaxID=44489 RepID=UPI003EBE2D91